MRLSKAQRVALFLVATFAASDGLALALVAHGNRMGSPAARLVSILYVFVPGFMAVVVRGAIARMPMADALGLRPRVNRWLFIGWGLPVVVLVLAFGLYAGLPGHHLVTTTTEYLHQVRAGLPEGARAAFDAAMKKDSPPSPTMLVVEGMFAGVVNIVFGLGIELGWRGFLLAEIEAGFWRRSFITGAVWGAWLVPLVLLGYMYPQHPRIGAAVVFAYTLLWSPALVLIRARSRTIWAPALLQGTLIALARPAEQLTIGGTDLIKPFAGITGLLATAVVVTTLILIARRPRGFK